MMHYLSAFDVKLMLMEMQLEAGVAFPRNKNFCFKNELLLKRLRRMKFM